MQRQLPLLVSLVLVAALGGIALLAQGLDMQTLLIVGVAKGIILVFGVAWVISLTKRHRDRD